MFMAPAPGSTSNSSVHLPPITVDVDVLSRTESAELRTAWQWWQTLFTTAANTFVHSLHLEPEHDHYRLRSRSASTLDEELLQTSEPLKTAISALIEQCWGKQVARHARHQRHLQLSWQQSRLYISVDCIETNRGTSFQFSFIKNPECRSTLDELGFRDKDLSSVRNLLKDAQGNLLVIGSDAAARATVIRALAQELNSPDRKIIAAESVIHPFLPRINQVVYPGLDKDNELAHAHWQRAAGLDADAIFTTSILPEEDRDQLRQLAQENRYVVSGMAAESARDALLQILADGSSPQWIATTVQAMIIQHRIQTLCKNCFESLSLSDEESNWISAIQPRMSENFATWLTVNMNRSYTDSPGCRECHQTGTGSIENLFEVIELSPSVRENLLVGDISEALDLIDDQLPLSKRLLALAGEGEINVSEAIRITARTHRIY